MSPRLFAMLAAAGLLAVPRPSLSQQRPTLDAAMDRTTMHVGDRVGLTITVSHDPDDTVLWPRPDSLGSWDVLDIGVAPPVRGEDRLQSSARLVLTAFELGELEVPELGVAVVRAGGDTTLFATPTFQVTVETIGLDDEGDIRDIKAPLEIARNWWLLAPWFLLVAAVVGAGYWLHRRYKRPLDGPVEIIPAAPPRPAHEVAYEALDRLERGRMLETGEVKRYFIDVSEIVRTYVNGRFEIDAMDMTSYDIVAALECLPLERNMVERFRVFFERSDLVKFAKFRPDEPACRAIVPMARALVDDTHRPDVVVDDTAVTEPAEAIDPIPAATAGSVER